MASATTNPSPRRSEIIIKLERVLFVTLNEGDLFVVDGSVGRVTEKFGDEMATAVSYENLLSGADDRMVCRDDRFAVNKINIEVPSELPC